MKECILKTEHLKKYYGQTLGIEDISIKLNKGEIYVGWFKYICK